MAEHLADIAAWRMQWMASLSDDQKAAMQADRAKWAAEETKQALMQEMAATFQAADTNADGVLDRAEFEDFMQKMQQNAAARGAPSVSADDVSDDLKEKMWAFYDAEGAQPGVSMADFGTATQKIAAHIKAAMGQ